MKILIAYLKKETVLCIAVLLAAFSMPLIHPDSKYSGYMDYRTLALLFSLMTIMEGFKQTGFLLMWPELCLVGPIRFASCIWFWSCCASFAPCGSPMM